MPRYTSLLPEILDQILSQLSLPDALSLHEAIPHPTHTAHIRARIARIRHLRHAWVYASQTPLRAYSNPPTLRTRQARERCSVREFCSLTVLPLSGSGLRSLEGIGELDRLKLLDVGRNELNELPGEIVKCVELRVLHLGWNRFDKFPNVVLRLPKLTTLLLHHNRIRSLPDHWGSLPNLYRLGLYKCEIDKVPEELCRVLGTQTVHRRSRSANLSGNQIERQVVQALFHRYPAMMNAVMI